MANEIGLFELKSGAQIPSVGLGTYAVPPEIIYAAVKMGYRHIDCAHVYGNEKEIGYVLNKLFDEGIVERKDLFITSKLSNSDHAPEDVPEALNTTLSNLQLDHLNLYLIHWPVKLKKGSSGKNPEDFQKSDIPSTWKAMEALYHSGKTRAIGVSNFSKKKLGQLLEVAHVPPAVNQVECHPLWQQADLHAFCKANGIHLSGYSPLGSQRPNGVLVDPVVKMVAEKLGKSPGQVALRWGFQMGHSVIPKTSTEARLKGNLDIFGWSIPQDLMLKFSEIKQTKYIKGEELVHEKSEGYKTTEELWDGEV